VYSVVLAIITVITLSAYPLEPIQLTFISVVTIGVPGFFLALGPNRRRYVPGFLGRVLRFSIPAGVITGLAAYGSYAVARGLDPGAGVAGARTTATVVVLIAALWTLVILARPLTAWKLALVAAMVGVVVLVLLVPALGSGIVLLEVTPGAMVIAVPIGVGAALLVEVVERLTSAITGRWAGVGAGGRG
jgi:cation-transporting P-type ATPase E